MSTKGEDKDKKTADTRDESRSAWKNAIGYFTMRVCDSAYMPWALVALFVLGALWVLTRNLDSKDELKFLWSIGSLYGFAWIGWGVALLEIPIARWVFNRALSDRDREIRRIREENAKARKLLSRSKQAELDLKPERDD